MPASWSVADVSRRRPLTAVVTTLVMAAALVAVPSAARADDPPQPETFRRAVVVQAWQSGGQLVRAGAERALLGSDADVATFLDTSWSRLQAIDERISVNRVMSSGGPAVRQAAQRALDSDESGALADFLAFGWRTPAHIDQRLRVNQIMSGGGAVLKSAAQKALDADSTESNAPEEDEPDDTDVLPALDTFLNTGWQTPFGIDQRIRVNQIMSGGGPEVKKAAQQALDARSVEALTAFIDSGWAVAAARDQETTAITDLVASANAASAEATRQTDIAKEESTKAVTAANAARQSAQDAADAVDGARGNAQAAAQAAKRAEEAGNDAARAAQEAVSASRAAIAASRVAASAAARASAAAAMTEKAAARARKAAADAATDQRKASAATDAAKSARDVALAAKTVADASAAAENVAREAGKAAGAAGQAVGDAGRAVQAAADALERARQTGVNVAQAVAAAKRARANAARSNRAAQACVRYANAAADAAADARAAALRAIDDANAAAVDAVEAAAHAGDATQAARRSTAAADAALKAATDAVDSANRASAVYNAAREVDAERLAVLSDQGGEAAQAAKATWQAYRRKAAWDTQEAAKRNAETDRLVAEARDPLTDRQTAVADSRKAALALSTANGVWTRQAAIDALGSPDELVLQYARTGVDIAAAQDDRATVAMLADTGSEAMAKAAEAALAGTDADVARFLTTQDYPERALEDRIAVNRIMDAARRNDDTVTVDEAQQALDAHSDKALRDFVTTGQFTAADIDERVKVNRILSDTASGPELKAAAQIALDGTPAALHTFLISGRFTAQQNDENAASHNAEMLALLNQAAAAATVATQQAQLAQEVAAKARDKGHDAEVWAGKAADSAKAAKTLSEQAVASANEAQRSADKAAATARTAVEAAKAANAASQRAAHSAAWAQDSYGRAQNAAVRASRSASEARTSAINAGKDADTAAEYYLDAYRNIAAVAEQQRRTENTHQYMVCQAQNLPGTSGFMDCVHHITDSDSEKLNKATVNVEICQKIARQDSAYFKNCRADAFNPSFGTNRALDFAQAFLSELNAFGVTGVVGGAALLTAALCNAVCASLGAVAGGAEVSMGIGGVFELWAESSLIDMAAGGVVGERSLGALTRLNGVRVPAIFEKITVENESAQSIFQRLAARYEGCLGNAFALNGLALLGDRTGGYGSLVHTAQNRRRGADIIKNWTDAVALRSGDELNAPHGSGVRTVGVGSHTDVRELHNRTVASPQAGDAIAAGSLVSAHKAGCFTLPSGYSPRITEDGLDHSFDRHARQWFGGKPTRNANMAEWRSNIDRASRSSQVLPWSSGDALTYAYLARIDGKWFVVQFDRSTGELVTAFVPNGRQLGAMLRLLG